MEETQVQLNNLKIKDTEINKRIDHIYKLVEELNTKVDSLMNEIKGGK